jgi:hypothetical protein
MKTIEINNKQYQECDVVMLETSKTNNLNDIVLNPDKTKLATLNPLTIDSKQPCTNQHLYILSNDEIKEGDWCISMNLAYKKPFQCTNLLYAKEYNCKKILATTDTSLEIKISRPLSVTRLLPQIPTIFIQQYIDAYNNGNVIEKCLVEVECPQCQEWGYISQCRNNCNKKFIQIKLNQNNEISILTEPKQMFSRENIMSALHKVELKHNKDYSKLWNEIEENLK